MKIYTILTITDKGTPHEYLRLQDRLYSSLPAAEKVKEKLLVDHNKNYYTAEIVELKTIEEVQK